MQTSTGRVSEPGVRVPRRPAEARPPIRVVIADEAYLGRQAISHLLADVDTVVVVGECADATAVPALVDSQRADLLITGTRMPPFGADAGIRLAAGLRETHPALGVLIISAHADVSCALKLFADGWDGRGYLLKDRIRDRQQLIDAAVTVANSGSVTDSTVLDALVHSRARGNNSRLDDLTPREIETLTLVAEGCSNADIAGKLVLTKRAVEKHINAIFAKLDLGDPDHVSRRVKAALVYLAERDASPAGQ